MLTIICTSTQKIEKKAWSRTSTRRIFYLHFLTHSSSYWLVTNNCRKSILVRTWHCAIVKSHMSTTWVVVTHAFAMSIRFLSCIKLFATFTGLSKRVHVYLRFHSLSPPFLPRIGALSVQPVKLLPNTKPRLQGVPEQKVTYHDLRTHPQA